MAEDAAPVAEATENTAPVVEESGAEVEEAGAPLLARSNFSFWGGARGAERSRERGGTVAGGGRNGRGRGAERLSDQVAPARGRFPLQKQRAQKSIEDMFKWFTWAKNEGAIVTDPDRAEVSEERRRLQGKLKELLKVTNPHALKIAEAQRLLTMLREKLAAAAKPDALGRYTKREAQVVEAKAEMAAVETAQQEMHKQQEKLLSNIARDTALVQALPGKELAARGAPLFSCRGRPLKAHWRATATRRWMS